MDLKIGDIQETALITLAIRASETDRPNARIKDSKAKEIIDTLGIDVSKYDPFMSHEGVVEPLGGLAVVLLASVLTPILPYMLAFAAGAMCYVVVEELIPEASSGEHSNLSTIGFAIGFVLMMVLDVVLG